VFRSLPFGTRGTISVDHAGAVEWKTTEPAQLYFSADNGREIVVGEGAGGSFQPDWLAARHTYIYELRTVRLVKGSEQVLDAVSYQREGTGEVSIVRLGRGASSIWLLLLGLIIVGTVFAYALLTGRLPFVEKFFGALSRRVDPCLLLIVLAEIALFSIPFKGYLFGDSLAQLYDRPATLLAALASFVHIGSWYRPLSQGLICYILFPIFKTNFAWYHGLMMLLHIIVTCLVYAGLRRLSANRVVAFAGAFFFAIHSVNFYTTYDTAFFADPSVAICYLVGIWAFFSRRPILASIAFVVGLWSKEAAVTMPLTIAALVAGVPALRKEWKTWAWRLAPLLAILVIYIGFYSTRFKFVGGGISSSTRSDYLLGINSTLLANAGRYVHWVFQIPSGWLTEAWLGSGPFLQVAYVFAFAVAAFLAYALVTGNVNARIALVWFIITALPVVTLNRYFVHHIYLPLIGSALLIAEFFALAQKRLPRPVFAGLLAVFLLNHAHVAYRNVNSDLFYSWVGDSARKSLNATQFVRAHPDVIKNASVVYVINETGEDIRFAYLKGSIFRHVAGLAKLEAHIVHSSSEVPAELPGNTLILRYRDLQLFYTSKDGSGVAAATARPTTGAVSLSQNGELHWQASGPSVMVVAADSGHEKLISALVNGDTTVNLPARGGNLDFKLRATSDGTVGPVVAGVSYVGRAGGATTIEPLATTPEDLDVAMERVRVTGDGDVLFRTKGVSQLLVSCDGSADQLFIHGAWGQQKPDWLAAGHTYRFTLREHYSGKTGRVLDVIECHRELSGRVVMSRADIRRLAAWPWVATLVIALAGSASILLRARRLAPQTRNDRDAPLAL
jgi:hypothetical protein